jgi:hypothetical protein
MENLTTTSPEQAKNNQASNEQIQNKKPKKTWVEPELVRMGVEGGTLSGTNESAYYTGAHGTAS